MLQREIASVELEGEVRAVNVFGRGAYVVQEGGEEVGFVGEG